MTPRLTRHLLRLAQDLPKADLCALDAPTFRDPRATWRPLDPDAAPLTAALTLLHHGVNPLTGAPLLAGVA